MQSYVAPVKGVRVHLADRIGIVQLASNAPLLSEGLLRFYLACRSPLLSGLLLPNSAQYFYVLYRKSP